MNGKPINVNSMNTYPDFNMSSISIKKSIVKINKADKINISQDTLMYLYALESNKKIINGKEKLTYYMFHNSASNIVSNNFEEYKKIIISNSDLILDSYILFNNFFHSKKAINFLNARTTGVEIDKYIFASDKAPYNLINYIINSFDSLKRRVVLFSLCILIKIYPRTRKYISNKMWNIHRKWANKII